ncbi:DUF4245 domain-containing protein [Kribbella deserti]|uniref:DUF4245 domain-containing protein n=1 Tax=Kribbella deserti TaxID=1926257 RepID=A0ABV6QMR0_9ACTN
MSSTDNEAARVRAEALAARAQSKADRAKYRTMRNMVWSMLACLGVVAFIAAVTWRPHEEKIRAVDYSNHLAEGRKLASWLKAPEPMPTDWQATSVELRAPEQSPITWHLGIITNEKKYVGLEQSNMAPRKFLSEELGKTEDDGVSTVNGATWQRKALLDRENEHAIILAGTGVTTIIVGNAGYPALETLAATLR